MRSQVRQKVVELLKAANLPHVTDVFEGFHVNLWDGDLPAARVYVNHERNPAHPDAHTKMNAASGTWFTRVELVIEAAIKRGFVDRGTEAQADEVITEIKRVIANNTTNQLWMDIHFVGMKIFTKDNQSQDIYMPSLLFTALVFQDLRATPVDPIADCIDTTVCVVPKVGPS